MTCWSETGHDNQQIKSTALNVHKPLSASRLQCKGGHIKNCVTSLHTADL